MDKLRCMEVFQQVAREKSFTRAADIMGLSPAMVSRYVYQLEDYLNLRLLHRTSRRVNLTQDGEVYLERVSIILSDIEDTESMVNQLHQRPKGVLRISAPVWLCQKEFMSALAEYIKLYTEVNIDLQVGDEIIDLTESGYDLVLRVTSNPQENLFARELAALPFVFVASHEYLSTHGSPQSLAEIAQHGVIMNTSVKSYQNGLQVTEKGKSIVIPVNHLFQCNNTVLLARAAAAGLGITALPKILLKNAEFEDRLGILLPDIELPVVPRLYAMYTSKRLQSPKVRTFIDFMHEYYREK